MNRLVPFTLAWLLFALTVLCVRRPRHARTAAPVVPPVLEETVPVAEVAGRPPWDELPAPCCGTMPDLAHEDPRPGQERSGEGRDPLLPPAASIMGLRAALPGETSRPGPDGPTLRAELSQASTWEPGWDPPTLAALAGAPSCLDYEPDWLAARLAEGERWRARVAAMIEEAW